MKETIAYCVPEFPSQTHVFFWREATAIKAEGFGVEFVSTQHPTGEVCRHAFADEALRSTHYVYPPRFVAVAGFLAMRPRHLAKAIGYVMSLRETSFAGRLRLLAMILCAADLVMASRKAGARHIHIHSFAMSAHLGAMARLLGDVSYSLTLHGDLPLYGVDHVEKMRNAAFVTAVTTPLRDQIESVLPGRDPLVISMGVDVDRFVPGTRIADPSGEIHAVSVARLNKVKGHLFFLEAMARLVGEGVPLRYSIAGNGPYQREIEDKIAELRLGDRVTLLGSISEDDVLRLLHRADLFVLSSFGQGEAAPVAVMEAMSCGVPVVCSRIGGTGDMIEDGIDSFLVNQCDADSITDAVRRLARDPALRTRIGLAARQTALAKFDYRIKARELCQAIRQSAIVARQTA